MGDRVVGGQVIPGGLVRPFGPLVRLTARGVLGRRRTLLMALAAAVPVVVAAFWMLTGQSADPDIFATQVLDPWVITTVLPLVALVLGTSVLGSEIEDGTLVFLLAKPVPRWIVVAAKTVVAALASAVLVTVSTLLCWVIGLGPAAASGEVVGIAAGVAFGAVLYSCIAVALSSVTSRALIVGLVYVFLWEGTLAGLLAGTRLFSVRQYVLGIAGITSEIDRPLGGTLDAPAALLLGLAVIAISLAVAIVRLRGYEVAERP
jgi:ABC-2 type transport system permease protein